MDRATEGIFFEASPPELLLDFQARRGRLRQALRSAPAVAAVAAGLPAPPQSQVHRWRFDF